MNVILRWTVLATLMVLANSGGMLSAQETEADSAAAVKSPLRKLELNDGDSIVFLGDSITHQRLYTQYVEDFLYTRYPGIRIRTHNAGVGGARAWDALERFDRDVAAYKPKYVTVLLGMNDGSYQPYNEEIFQKYRADMTTLIDRIRAIGAEPILMTPTMFDSRAARVRRRWEAGTLALYNSVLAYYGTWLRDVAVENGFGFVDMWSPLNNLTLVERKLMPAFTMIQDAVHPDPPGQIVMAYAMIEDLGLRGPLSTIRIIDDATSGAKAVATGGEVSDLKTTDNGLEFTWRANALPWVVPAEAKPGAKLLHLGHRAGREALQVHTLAVGKYELQIDDAVVGTYTSVQLQRGIELQDNELTPQYQQAAQVAELNKQRNVGPVSQLRNEWRTFQQFARQRVELEKTPDNADLKSQVAALEQKLAGQDDRIARHEADARSIEDQIFAINQPQARRMLLTRK